MSVVGHLLNVTVEVWRLSRAHDGQGGFSETMSLDHTERARVSTPTSRDEEVAQRRGVEITYVAYLEPDADVARGDELRGASITRYGPPLEVTAELPPSEPKFSKVGLATSRRAAA